MIDSHVLPATDLSDIEVQPAKRAHRTTLAMNPACLHPFAEKPGAPASGACGARRARGLHAGGNPDGHRHLPC